MPDPLDVAADLRVGHGEKHGFARMRQIEIEPLRVVQIRLAVRAVRKGKRAGVSPDLLQRVPKQALRGEQLHPVR